MALETVTMTLMKQVGLDIVPPVSWASDEAVNEHFDFFDERDPDPRLTAVAYPLFSGIYLPRVAFDLGAPAAITGHLDNDGQIDLELDHVRGDDPIAYGGATFSSTTLRRIRKKADIMAKPVLLDEQPLLSSILANLGAFTAGREQDMNNPRFGAVENWEEPLTPELKARQALIARRTVQTGVKRANRFNHHGGFPGGTRRDPNGEPLAAKDVKTGSWRIMHESDHPENFRIVCGAIRYTKALRPIVAFGYPHEVPDTADEYKELVADGISQCVGVTKWMEQHPRPNRLIEMGKLAREWLET